MDVGRPELLIILLVVMLVFGGKKLPELARGGGRALRIFKAEMDGIEETSAATAGHDVADGDLEAPGASDGGTSRHDAEPSD